MKQFLIILMALVYGLPVLLIAYNGLLWCYILIVSYLKEKIDFRYAYKNALGHCAWVKRSNPSDTPLIELYKQGERARPTNDKNSVEYKAWDKAIRDTFG